MGPRWISSLLRAAAYLVAALLLWSARGAESPVIAGAATGAVLADTVTFLLRTILLLPRDIAAGAVDALVTAGGAIAILACTGFAVPADNDGMAAGFCALLLMLSVKVLWYGMEWVAGE